MADSRKPGVLGAGDHGARSQIADGFVFTPAQPAVKRGKSPGLVDVGPLSPLLRVVESVWSAYRGALQWPATTTAPGAVLPEGGDSSRNDQLISLEMLKAAEPSTDDNYYKQLLVDLPIYAGAYGVDTELRIAHFLATVAHESRLRAIAENGNYSAKRMRKIFGCKGGPDNYDPQADDCGCKHVQKKQDCTCGRLKEKLWSEPLTYANNAENLLAYVYAERMGNGTEVSRDGFTFRGRGMIQLTGRSQYRAFTVAHNKAFPDDPQDFEKTPDLLLERKYAIESAFWYWQWKAINADADLDNISKVTKKVNGGSNGLPDRQTRLTRIRTVQQNRRATQNASPPAAVLDAPLNRLP